jgi:hypothetical protein
MKVAVAASVSSAVACTAMLGVTVSLLRHRPEAAASVPAQPIPASPAAPPQRLVIQLPATAPIPMPLGADPAPPREGRSPMQARLSSLRVDPPISPAVAALAGKLHLRPGSVARLAGEGGEVPAVVVARLERASNAGKALAVRLGLDETNTEVFGNLFLDQVIALMDEERQNGSAPDAARIEAITRDTLDGVRATAGEGAVAEAERELGKLR